MGLPAALPASSVSSSSGKSASSSPPFAFGPWVCVAPALASQSRSSSSAPAWVCVGPAWVPTAGSSNAPPSLSLSAAVFSCSIAYIMSISSSSAPTSMLASSSMSASKSSKSPSSMVTVGVSSPNAIHRYPKQIPPAMSPSVSSLFASPILAPILLARARAGLLRSGVPTFESGRCLVFFEFGSLEPIPRQTAEVCQSEF